MKITKMQRLHYGKVTCLRLQSALCVLTLCIVTGWLGVMCYTSRMYLHNFELVILSSRSSLAESYNKLHSSSLATSTITMVR